MKAPKSLLTRFLQWFDTAVSSFPDPNAAPGAQRVDWVRVLPFLGMHLACLGVLWVGWSWSAVIVAAALYVLRMFAVTGFYHRYFSHRTYETTRAAQFAFAVLGASALSPRAAARPRGSGVVRCVVRPTIANITAPPIPKTTYTHLASTASGGATWGGSHRRSTSRPI